MSIIVDAIKSLARKPSTIEYPKVEAKIEPDFRGIHYPHLGRCIGCSYCMIVCPSQCIRMERLPEDVKLKHNKRNMYPVIDYASCVYCHRCVKVCPTEAYVVTNEYRVLAMRTSRVSSRELSLLTLKEVSQSE